MFGKAVSKLKTEMEANKNNSYVQVVGKFLLQHLEENPAAAEKIMSEDKTIAKSLDAMKTEAQKKKVGNCAVLTDQEGFAVVLKYFDIKGKATKPASAAPPVVDTPAPETNNFNVSLDELLG